MSGSDYAMLALLVGCLAVIVAYVWRFGGLSRPQPLVAPPPEGTKIFDEAPATSPVVAQESPGPVVADAPSVDQETREWQAPIRRAA